MFLYIGIWHKHLNTIIIIWLSLSIANQFSMQNVLLSKLLITPYAGHFSAGMILYQILKGDRNAKQILIMSLSWICFYHYINGHFSYINNNFSVDQDSNTAIIIPVIIVALVYMCAVIQPSKISDKVCTTLGLASYPLYLIHIDVGFWPRAFTDRILFKTYPWAGNILTPEILMILAITSSIILSIIIALYIEPTVRKIIASLIGKSRMQVSN